MLLRLILLNVDINIYMYFKKIVYLIYLFINYIYENLRWKYKTYQISCYKQEKKKGETKNSGFPSHL